MTAITLPASLTSIGDHAFLSCTGLTTFNFDANLNTIGTYAFGWCNRLASVSLLATAITRIEDFAFYNCTGLKSVIIPSNLNSIGDDAFSGCTGLTAITLPASLNSIGDDAFYNCTSLTAMNLPASVTSIADFAFESCSKLTTFTVDPSNPNYSSTNGVLFDKTQTTLLQFPMGKTGSYTLPSSVTRIGNAAFESCTGLTSLTLPTNLNNIGNYAFFKCTGLTSLTILSGLTSLQEGCFQSCTKLTSVTLPASVNTLGDGIFYGCSLLKTAIFKGNAPTLGILVFDLTAAGFKVNFYNETTGFTVPTWNGYASLNLGDSSPIFTWLHANGLAYSADLSSTPNHDGVPILMDYALNLTPTLTQSGNLPKPVISGNQMSLTYYAGKTDVQYRVEISSDLQSWTTSGITLSAPDINGLRTAAATLSTPRLFMHLKVTR